MSKKTYSPVKVVLRDYLRESWKYKKLSLPGLLLPGIGSTFVFYLPPLVIAAAIRDFNGAVPGDLSVLLPYLIWLSVAWFIGELCWHAAFLIMSRYQAWAINDLYVHALDELLKKDADFFNNNFTGSLTKRVNAYAANYENFLDTFSYSIIGNLLPLVFAVVILATISPLLVIVLIGLILLTFVIIYPMIRKRLKLMRIRESAGSRVSGHVSDVISNISAVQSFAHEKFEHKNHVKNVNHYTGAMLNAWLYDTTRIHRTVSPINVVTNVVGLIVAVLISKDATTIAAIFVTFSYFGNATRIMFDFNNIYRRLEMTLSSSAEFTELLEHDPLIVDAPHATTISVAKGDIEFRNVTFAYPERKNDPLFVGFNLKVAAGQKIALVGRSGGGKTSITRLLLRFSDVDKGEVLIDEQNIAQTTLSSLRHSIAYVPQDPAMFHRSIRENIRYGRLDATDEEVHLAAKKAHALEFIDKLPDGFETLVGERGVKLSGGQRQRIAIARAILKDAPILILDEATSALDSESEKLIQDALKKLMDDRTSIVIAHRLSTIAKLDRIIVLDNGSIVEDGTHRDLLNQDGTYAKLWAHQSGGFIEE